MESEPLDDEFERTVINDAYARLARAIAVRAALDMVALRYDRSSRPYLLEWYRQELRDGDCPSKMAFKCWLTSRWVEVSTYLSDGGGELATAAGVYDLVPKAQGKCHPYRVWKAFKQKKNRPCRTLPNQKIRAKMVQR